MVGLNSKSVLGPIRRVVATAQNGLEVVRLGGLETDATTSPFEIVERAAMYRLRRYFPDSDPETVGAPILLIPPMMMSANVYDVTRDQGAVGILHEMGLDPWVVDFGSPDSEEGGWDRNLADHIIALSDIVDHIHRHTGKDVHISGYSQGGMFAYQAAAYRRSRNIASVITFGSPVDTLAALPFGIPAGLATKGADFLADHVFNRLAYRVPVARSREDAEDARRLSASTARPGGVASAGAATTLPRDRGLGRVVGARGSRTAQAVHRAQPNDDRWVRHQGSIGLARRDHDRWDQGAGERQPGVVQERRAIGTDRSCR